MVSEVYLRSDIPCGLQECLICDISQNTLNFEESQSTLYILDTSILENHIEVLENCLALQNIIIT